MKVMSRKYDSFEYNYYYSTKRVERLNVNGTPSVIAAALVHALIVVDAPNTAKTTKTNEEKRFDFVLAPRVRLLLFLVLSIRTLFRKTQQ